MLHRHGGILVSVLTVGLCWTMCPAQQRQPDFLASVVKDSSYFGKWKYGDLLTRYCEKHAWSHDKQEDLVVFRGRLKRSGDELVAYFRIVSQPVGGEKDGRSRTVVFSPKATLGGKNAPNWQASVFEKEYLETGKIKIDVAKASVFYQWKVGDLLAKHCDKPAWAFNKEKDRAEFRGRLKKGGDELVVSFQVEYDPLDKSNTSIGWSVLDSEATLARKALGVGTTWRSRIFVDEERLMRKDKDEK
jgi:hypothetical protein